MQRIWSGLSRFFGILFLPSWVWLGAFPLALSGYLAPESFNDKKLSLFFAWVLFGTALVRCLRFRLVYLCLSVPWAVLYGLEVLHVLATDHLVNRFSVGAFFESNLQESQAFFWINFSWANLFLLLLYTGVGIALTAWDYRRLSAVPQRIPRTSFVLIVVFLLILGDRLRRDKSDASFHPVINALIEYQAEAALYRQALAERKAGVLKRSPVVAEALFPGQKQVHLVIIGESTSRSRMSLYGHERPTTPLLDQMSEELVVFDNAHTPVVRTSYAVQYAFSERNRHNQKPFLESTNIIEQAQAAGFRVFWLSNQFPSGFWDNSVALLGGEADRVRFVNQSDGQWVHSSSYDEKLIPELEAALQDKAEKKLIVLHLFGSHYTYAKRYPAGFAHFDPYVLDKKARNQNTYDNSIVYTDYVLHQFLSALQRLEAEEPDTWSSALFFSDHGEEVYDTADFAGHDMSRPTPPQIEVPLILWLSEGYRKAQPERYQSLQANRSHFYVTDDLFHLILDLSLIATPKFENRRSPASTAFVPTTKDIFPQVYQQN